MPDLISIIIPGFNEEKRIAVTLETLRGFCDSHIKAYEILFVDDGSTDRTPSILEDACRKNPSLRTLTIPENRGKGNAVREGMLVARGRHRFFTDADLPYGTACFLQALAVFKQTECDMVVGARDLPDSTDSVGLHWIRKIVSRMFSATANSLLAIDVKDSQCGFKGFTDRCARTIFSHSVIDSYAFDVELFILANRYNHDIRKVPVTLCQSQHSKVKLLRDPLMMLIDLIRLFNHERRLHG